MICRPFTLCLALLGLLSLPVFAAGTADDLLALHQMRLATQKSLNAFFMYVGQEGDQRYASLIESSAQTAEARLQRLDGVNGSESRRLLGQLREQWRDYAQDLDKLTGAVRNKGYSDLQPVADLARRNQQLMDLGGQLYRSLQRENAATVPTLTEQSREQSLLMQDIALDYASRNASVGASFFGGGEERPLDDLASRFSVNLLKLQQAPQNDEEIARALRSVAISGTTSRSPCATTTRTACRSWSTRMQTGSSMAWRRSPRCMPRATNEPRRAASGALAEKLGDAPEVGAIAALAPIQGKELGGRLHLVDIPGEAAQGVQQLIVRARLAPLVQPLARGILPIAPGLPAASARAVELRAGRRRSALQPMRPILARELHGQAETARLEAQGHLAALPVGRHQPGQGTEHDSQQQDHQPSGHKERTLEKRLRHLPRSARAGRIGRSRQGRRSLQANATTAEQLFAQRNGTGSTRGAKVHNENTIPFWEETFMPYQHILVAVDLTDECDPVMKRAAALATSNQARLSVVHVVEPMAMAFGGDVPMDLSMLQQQQFDQARERLDAFAVRYPDLGSEQRHLVYGQPRQEIHRLAAEQACDLIVVGSHGRHGLALLLGSTANDVLHGAPCDVLAVHLKKA